MAQLPKELHEASPAEVMRRHRLAENAAINAVWRAFQRQRLMIRIAITAAAFDAINAALPLGTVAFDAKTGVKGELGT